MPRSPDQLLIPVNFRFQIQSSPLGNERTDWLQSRRLTAEPGDGQAIVSIARKRRRRLHRRNKTTRKEFPS